jgi:hypothetical protein
MGHAAPPIPHSLLSLNSCRRYAKLEGCGLSGIGTYAGAPFGVSLIGWAGSDEVLLDLALALADKSGSINAWPNRRHA